MTEKFPINIKMLGEDVVDSLIIFARTSNFSSFQNLHRQFSPETSENEILRTFLIIQRVFAIVEIEKKQAR